MPQKKGRTLLFTDEPILSCENMWEMASVCSGNRELIYSRLESAVVARRQSLKRAIFNAQNRLLLSIHGKQLAQERKNSLKAITRIKNAAIKLENLLSEIEIEAPAGTAKTLTFYAQSYMYSDSSQGLGSSYESDIKIENWLSFHNSLNEHIRVLSEISAFIRKDSKSGRPNQLEGLTEFVHEISILYQYSTKKKFTVDEYRENGTPVALTEGMIFVQKALTSIYTTSSTPEFKNWLSMHRYTPENFQNACVYTARRLHKTEKM